MNFTEMEQQQNEIQKICDFFNCSPISITYYSCIHPKELFEIRGFDYHPMMYSDQTGGMADYGNLIFSGNNSEMYTHEILHIYTHQLFPKINTFLDEGLSTYLAGSGKYNYLWHRNKMKKFIAENKDFDFAHHTDAYERIYFEGETSIPYTTAGLIMERTLKRYGKNGLFTLLNTTSDLWSALKRVGLTKENINAELRNQLNQPLELPW